MEENGISQEDQDVGEALGNQVLSAGAEVHPHDERQGGVGGQAKVGLGVGGQGEGVQVL